MLDQPLPKLSRSAGAGSLSASPSEFGAVIPVLSLDEVFLDYFQLDSHGVEAFQADLLELPVRQSSHNGMHLHELESNGPAALLKLGILVFWWVGIHGMLQEGCDEFLNGDPGVLVTTRVEAMGIKRKLLSRWPRVDLQGPAIVRWLCPNRN